MASCIGIEPGKPSAPKDVEVALNAAPAEALPRFKTASTRAGGLANGSRTNLTAIGTYGTDYLHRAGVDFGGLGANVPEDAVYRTAFADSDGQPFTSEKRSQEALHT